MNAIILAVLVMVALCMLRVSVVFALIASALVGGLFAGLPMETVVKSFNEGLGGGAPVALAYATLGAFAIALSRTGLSQRLSANLTDRLGEGGGRFIKWAILLSMVLAGIASQTLVPVHIAFIPLLVPPLLHVMNRLQLDRRAVACAITFAITTTYMTLPLGFGAIFLNDILVANINGAGSGELVSREMAPVAMLIPALGMVFGLGLALLWSYRQPRAYADRPVAGEEGEAPARLSRRQLTMVLLALVLALVVQLWTGSMIFGGLVGFSLVSMSGVIRWNEQDGVFLQGMRLMALVGFIMIAASGFAGVMKATGEIQTLVAHSAELVGGNRALAAFMMLLVGLLITMGIGSSFPPCRSSLPSTCRWRWASVSRPWPPCPWWAPLQPWAMPARRPPTPPWGRRRGWPLTASMTISGAPSYRPSCTSTCRCWPSAGWRRWCCSRVPFYPQGRRQER